MRHLKLMREESTPDHDSRKSHRLVPLKENDEVEFTRLFDGRPHVKITNRYERGLWQYFPHGNTYLTDSDGKNISSFAYSPAPSFYLDIGEVNFIVDKYLSFKSGTDKALQAAYVFRLVETVAKLFKEKGNLPINGLFNYLGLTNSEKIDHWYRGQNQLTQFTKRYSDGPVEHWDMLTGRFQEIDLRLLFAYANAEWDKCLTSEELDVLKNLQQRDGQVIDIPDVAMPFTQLVNAFSTLFDTYVKEQSSWLSETTNGHQY